MSASATIISPSRSSTAVYVPLQPSSLSAPRTSMPRLSAWASRAAPELSAPIAVSRATVVPRRARFSAMLRATPPNDSLWLAGLDVRSASASVERSLRSRFAAPTHTTGLRSGST